MSIANRIVLLCLLCLLACSPLAAQNVPTVRPMVAPANVGAIQVDWKARHDKQVEKNKQLRAENDDLRAQLAAWVGKGGSQVHAYCETETLSRNTAGASNDCAASGYTCESVSGLCRTSAANSSQCATGRTWCVYGNRCVASAAECKP